MGTGILFCLLIKAEIKILDPGFQVEILGDERMNLYSRIETIIISFLFMQFYSASDSPNSRIEENVPLDSLIIVI